MILPRLPDMAAPVRPVAIHFDIAGLVKAGTTHPAAAPIATAAAWSTSSPPTN